MASPIWKRQQFSVKFRGLLIWQGIHADWHQYNALSVQSDELHNGMSPVLGKKGKKIWG